VNVTQTEEFEIALAELGVSDVTVSLEAREELATHGFALLEWVMPAALVGAFREITGAIELAEGSRAGMEFQQEEGAGRLSNLIDKDPLFDECFRNPFLLSAVSGVFSDAFKVSALNSRSALQGAGHQALHRDFQGASVPPGEFQTCNSIWLLDDFTEENGATRVVPGSHRWPMSPSQVIEDPSEAHPDEVLLLGRAGSVFVLNGHLWHGGTRNRSGRPRRALHSYFCVRGQAQQLCQAEYLRSSTKERFSRSERYLLDI
jgi:hypothetical protein